MAAINLFTTLPEPAEAAIAVVRELHDHKVGCCVGLACGLVFCGLVGCDSACRWDITGPACVRACRLMQHAMAQGLHCITDDSVYNTLTNVSLLQAIGPIPLKGGAGSVQVLGQRINKGAFKCLPNSYYRPTVVRKLVTGLML